MLRRCWSVLEQVSSYLPIAAIASGLLLLLASQKDRIVAFVAKFRPATKVKAEPTLSPAERFERFYALRTWCETAGQTNAVKALDSVVLPAIVQGGRQ